MRGANSFRSEEGHVKKNWSKSVQDPDRKVTGQKRGPFNKGREDGLVENPTRCIEIQLVQRAPREEEAIQGRLIRERI